MVGLAGILAALFELGWVSYHIGYDNGHLAEMDREYKAEECGCGTEQSCVFGPGIVGVQHCGYSRKWSRCEPAPPAPPAPSARDGQNCDWPPGTYEHSCLSGNTVRFTVTTGTGAKLAP